MRINWLTNVIGLDGKPTCGEINVKVDAAAVKDTSREH